MKPSTAMNETELADILRRMYRNAPRGEKVAAIHLFGIRSQRSWSRPA